MGSSDVKYGNMSQGLPLLQTYAIDINYLSIALENKWIEFDILE
jgi:hypothetical protein